VHPDPLGFEPRLAISWRPSLSSSLVIKGGYGLYRNLGVYQRRHALAQQPPFSSAFNVQNTLAVPLSLANPFPAAIPSATTFAPIRISRQRSCIVAGHGAARSAGVADRARRLLRRSWHASRAAFLPNTYPRGLAIRVRRARLASSLDVRWAIDATPLSSWSGVACAGFTSR
jgi:hypothetical protein